jgi:hypothetical protein
MAQRTAWRTILRSVFRDLQMCDSGSKREPARVAFTRKLLDKRAETKVRKVRHDFAFSGLVYCGRCGCLLVGEMKKGRYVYYHCTGNRGNAPNRTRPNKSSPRSSLALFVSLSSHNRSSGRT